jgi:hypothetical protein
MGGSTSRLNFSRQGDARPPRDSAAPVVSSGSERLYRAIGGCAPAIVWMDDTEALHLSQPLLVRPQA